MLFVFKPLKHAQVGVSCTDHVTKGENETYSSICSIHLLSKVRNLHMSNRRCCFVFIVFGQPQRWIGIGLSSRSLFESTVLGEGSDPLECTAHREWFKTDERLRSASWIDARHARCIKMQQRGDVLMFAIMIDCDEHYGQIPVHSRRSLVVSLQHEQNGKFFFRQVTLYSRCKIFRRKRYD